jgi:small-conductance mechanosensitive channel
MSVAYCSINITSAKALEEVEKVIKDSLPEIKNKISAITSDIDYKGITNITDITTELLFTAQCYEEDLYQVQRDLHRELKLLLDKNGIDCFAPPTYMIDDKTKQKKEK